MNQNKIILDLCGGTGAWSKPYKDAGYRVFLLTLPDCDIRKVKITNNCLGIPYKVGAMDGIEYIGFNRIYGILAAPPCDQFSFAKTTGNPRDLNKAMSIVFGCLKVIWSCQGQPVSPYAKTTSLKFWALENPNGLLKYFLGKPAFEFDPWEFGDNYKKKTHLWGWFNEPKKNPIRCDKPKFDRLKTKEIHPEYYGKYTRKERRAITPQGFAKAFYEANK